MDQNSRTFELYIETLKAEKKGLPGCRKYSPHFRAISSATGLDLSYLTKGEGRQRVMLAVQEVGITPKEGTQAAKWEALFAEKRTIIHNYLRWIKDNGLELPENPMRKGKVFYEQLEIEAGLKPFALRRRSSDGEQAYTTLLRREIDIAASSTGVEVRVLPQFPGHKQTPLTYGRLLEKGCEVRTKELSGKPSDEQQIYNMRSALNRFLKELRLEKTSPVGHELVSDFKDSLEKVFVTILNKRTLKKFNTEICRWRDLYQELIKEPLIPDDLNEAILHLIGRSGLSYGVVAKLIGVSIESIKEWCHGGETPSALSKDALSRMESLFKLPAGTLVSKIQGGLGRKRFRVSQLPPFLQQNIHLYHRVSRHLPDDFCTLPLERQEIIVESICADILRGDDEYAQRLRVLSSLPYRLKDWPESLRKEFDTYARFKMDERPPLGMQRSGTWKPETKEKCEASFSYFFGAICLPPDAEDERLRGLGFPKSQLTLALLACPILTDWYIRFRCKVRNHQYTQYPIDLLGEFISMLQPGTGWLRQSPHVGRQLRPFTYCDTHYISQDMVLRVQTNWTGVCDDAITEYNKQISEIEPLVTVARDPFHRIKGILDMKDPMEPLGQMIQKMRWALPSRHTQPVLYHTGIRDCALVTLIVATGLRRGTIVKLDYTGDKTGHLYLEGGGYVLSVPRKLFKNDYSSFFGLQNSKRDYLNRLPNKFGLNEVFKEYLEVSRPFLMNKYHKQSGEQPLFVTSFMTRLADSASESARLNEKRMSAIYANKVERYLVENKHRGTGIPMVKRTGPHSARHIRGTKTFRKTRSYKLAGDANQNSERTAREHYSRFSTEELNQEVNEILFDDE